MKDFLLQLKDKFAKPIEDDEIIEEQSEEYLELGSSPTKEEQAKIIVRPFVIEEFERDFRCLKGRIYNCFS